MRQPGSAIPELALPVASFTALRAAVLSELGAEAGAHALQAAGHAAGDALFEILDASTGGAPGGVAEIRADAFWRRLAELFATRGWGHLAHDAVHPGLAALESPDWVEANAAGDASRPSCYFTTGLLACLLGRAADSDVGLLEVQCRSRGDLRCRFLFGGPDALGAAYDALCAGEDVDAALAELA